MKSQIANRKSQISKSIINQFYFRFIFCCAIIILLFPAKIFAQGNLNISLVPKTYVGNYHTSCYGSNNGEIEILISGGTAPYSVLWNNSSTANPLLNIGAGTYAVIVTDVNNASVADTITLIQPPALGYSLEVSQFGEYNLAYYGSTLGHIKINGTGGTPAYSVVWNDSNTELIRDSMSAGSYTFVLSDANGCTMNGTKTLTQPSILSSSTNLIHGVSCFGGEDGAAQVTPSGGIAPYSYLWDNGNFTATPNDLSSGWHLVHITDVADNHHADSILVTQASEISANISKSTYPNSFNVSCYNCFNGTLDATVSGGTAPYTYEWIWQDNNIGTTANLSNLGGGNYELIVSDQNNCRLRTETELKEPERQDWSMTGNAGTDPATQFIGTTDSVDVVFKSNNLTRLKIDGNGEISFPNLKSIENTSSIQNGPNSFSLLGLDGSGKFGKIEQEFLFQPCSTKKHVLGWVEAQAAQGANLHSPFDFVTCDDAWVGIGLSAPQSRLEVANGSVIFNNNFISLETGGVGIGTINPIEKLEVHGDNPTLKLHDNTSTANLKLLTASGSGRLISDNAFYLFLDADNSESNPALEGFHILINDSYDSPVAKELFQIDGNGIGYIKELFIREPNANFRFPDYVFDENYQLTPLLELEKYLTSKKHLKGIPSETQMKNAGGINVNDFLLQLLKNQEETTLYLIALQKEINALKEENATLRKTSNSKN